MKKSALIDRFAPRAKSGNEKAHKASARQRVKVRSRTSRVPVENVTLPPLS
jgi:hypothetical protein